MFAIWTNVCYIDEFGNALLAMWCIALTMSCLLSTYGGAAGFKCETVINASVGGHRVIK